MDFRFFIFAVSLDVGLCLRVLYQNVNVVRLIHGCMDWNGVLQAVWLFRVTVPEFVIVGLGRGCALPRCCELEINFRRLVELDMLTPNLGGS